MCLALYKPAKATLNQDEMRTAFKANPDGAGFAYYDPALRRVVTQRGYFEFNALWNDLKPIIDDKCPLILHFRWATHGEVTVDNCHPFELIDGALIHNGIIRGLGESCSYTMYKDIKDDKSQCNDRSDTREFVEDYLTNMNAEALHGAKKLIEFSIGYSKLVTIHNNGEVIIFNEDGGHWRNGVWYSNNSYEKSQAYTAIPTGAKPAVIGGGVVKPTAYDYHGKFNPLTDANEEIYDTWSPNECAYCSSNGIHTYTYDAVADVFLVTCCECGECWIVDGEELTIAEYNSMYSLASASLTHKGN